MLPKLLENQHVLGTRLSEVLISKKLLEISMVKGKTNWKQNKTKNKKIYIAFIAFIHGKLLQNAINCHLCYLICTYRKNKRIKISGGNFV